MTKLCCVVVSLCERLRRMAACSLDRMAARSLNRMAARSLDDASAWPC